VQAIFAVASFRNSSVQLFKPAWWTTVTLVSCSIVLSTYSFTSHCLKQFCESVKLSCHFTVRVVLAVDYSFKLWLICRKCSKKWIWGSLWKEKAFL